MKSISVFNPAITENTECSIVEVHASFINLKVGVSLDSGVLLHFVLLLTLRTCLATFQAKNNNIRNTPASPILTLVSQRSHNTHIANCHLRGSGEKMELKGEQR